jgi:hypothetical protein
MEFVFLWVCSDLAPWILPSSSVKEADQVSSVDGSVTRVLTNDDSNVELEIVMGGGNNANRVTARWGEKEIIIDRGSMGGFSVLYKVELRESATFKDCETLDDVFAYLVPNLVLV